MCSMSVLCPLCAQTSFSSIDALRCSLIKAANGPLACPICHELFLGLDKLTIHLFSHTNIMNANDSTSTIKQIPKIPTTTTETSSVNTKSSSNNNKNSNHDNEKLKAKENLSMVSENNTQDLNLSAEMSFESTHQHHHHHQHRHRQQQQQQQQHPPKEDHLVQASSQRTAVKKNKTSKSDRKINKKSQVSVGPENDATDSPPPPPLPPTVVDTQMPPTPLATCDICEFTFRNEELRDMHVRLVHQNFVYTNLTEAPGCNEDNTLTNSQFSPAVSEPDFKCHLCSKTFKMKGSLRVHLKVVHLMGLPYVNNSPKLSICDRIRHKENKQMKALNATGQDSLTTTPLAVNNLYNLQPITLIPTMTNDVNAANTLGNISVVNFTQSPDFISSPLDPNNSLNQNVLLVFNNSSSSQQIPQTISNPTPPTDNDKNSQTTNNNSHSFAAGALTSSLNSMDNPKIWECDVCSKAFTTKYFLKKHKRLHTGEMPYTCELCARTFTFQQSYHKHLLYHSDEKPHVCSTCGRAFKELSTLHNHERIHSGEKPFKCDVCGKSFRQRVSFLVHTRIHTGVMPYKCELCQKSFRYKVSQRTHKCQLASSDESPPQNETTTNTLDHISENFIKAFLENTTSSNSVQLQHSPPQNSPASNEIAAINEKAVTSSTSSGSPPSALNEQQALLSKTIDDIVVESCNKLGIGGDGGVSFTPVENDNEGSMSPSQKLQNMRLYSPQMVTPDLNGIDGDLTRFFLENSSGGQNIL